MTRGQLYSFDLLIAAAVLTAALGFAIQFTTLAGQQADALAPSQGGTAQTLAALLAENKADRIALSTETYCVTLTDGSGVLLNDSCAAFNASACSTVYAARRLRLCAGQACLLSVKTCTP